MSLYALTKIIAIQTGTHTVYVISTDKWIIWRFSCWLELGVHSSFGRYDSPMILYSEAGVKLAAILQTISSVKMFLLWREFHWNLFP